MKKYLIEKNEEILAFGLNEINAKNQYGNLNNLKEYQEVAVPNFDKRLYSCREITPILTYSGYKQQWKLFELPLNTAKKNTIKDFGLKTQNAIFEKYDSVKQASDTNDKEYYGAWLVTHFSSVYTTDNLYLKMFTSANKIFDGTSTFTDEITALKEVTDFADNDEEYKYPIALKQLLKVAVRQGWVQACKAEYSIKTAQVNNASTINDISGITLSFPLFPL